MVKRLIQACVFSAFITALFFVVASKARPSAPSALQGEFTVKIVSVEPISELMYSGSGSAEVRKKSKKFPAFYELRLQIQKMTAVPEINWRVRADEKNCTPSVGDIAYYRNSQMEGDAFNGNDDFRGCFNLQGYPAPAETPLSWVYAAQNRFGALTVLFIFLPVFIVSVVMLTIIGELRPSEQSGSGAARVAMLGIAASSVAILVAVVSVNGFSRDEHLRQQGYEQQKQVVAELQRKAAEEEKATVPPPVPAPTTHFKSDPNNSLPAYTVEELDSVFNSRRGGASLEGRKIRVKGKVKTLVGNSVAFMNTPQPFMMDWFRISGLSDAELDSLKEGDFVEVVCAYEGTSRRDDSPGDNFASMTYMFRGLEIH